MNHNQAVEKIRGMPLGVMTQMHLLNVKHNRSHQFVAKDYLTSLTEHEREERENEKINRLLAKADFKSKATMAENGYLQSRNRDENFQRSRDASPLTYLISDDFDLQASENQNCESLMDMAGERFKQTWTIISSQVPASAWFDII